MMMMMCRHGFCFYCRGQASADMFCWFVLIALMALGEDSISRIVMIGFEYWVDGLSS